MVKNCLNCGKEFSTNRENAKFCHHPCSVKFRNKNKRIPYLKHDGYIWLTVSPNIRRKVHDLTMEEVINRPLTENECVHHINGIRTDNRIENLQLMTKSEHAKLHSDIYINQEEYKPKKRGSGIFGIKVDVGTVTIRKNGHAFIKTENGWEMESRVVMSKYLGRKLLRYERVFHLDGNASNNDVSNLKIMTQAEMNYLVRPGDNSPMTKKRLAYREMLQLKETQE